MRISDWSSDVCSSDLMRGAAAAEIDGTLAAYVEAAFHHMWEEPKKMDDPAVMLAALKQSGLDADGIAARIQDTEVKQRLIANTEASVARGCFGSPSFRSEEHTSELQSLMRTSYAVFCLK